jgi:hypothetical protein
VHAGAFMWTGPRQEEEKNKNIVKYNKRNVQCVAEKLKQAAVSISVLPSIINNLVLA